MAEIKVVEANKELVLLLMGKLRDVDNEECLAASGDIADMALLLSFRNSTKCWVGLVDNRPFCCFGVAPSGIASLGIPWMLATDELKKAAREVATDSKLYIKKMLDEYSSLENWVDARNLTSIYWLKKCGFTIDAPEPYGVKNKLFHRFFMEG